MSWNTSDPRRLSLVRILKAAWSDFLGVTVSNEFSYKPIISESYRLLHIYANRIGILSKLDIFKLNKIISLWAKNKTLTKLHHRNA